MLLEARLRERAEEPVRLVVQAEKCCQVGDPGLLSQDRFVPGETHFYKEGP